jgi:hypothetical protein
MPVVTCREIKGLTHAHQSSIWRTTRFTGFIIFRLSKTTYMSDLALGDYIYQGAFLKA